MNITELRASFESLKDTVSMASDALGGRLAASYRESIISSYEPIVMSDEMDDSLREEVFLGLLRENLDLVKGSCLSYTASPKSPTTRFLVNVALYIAERENNKGCGMRAMDVAPKSVSEVSFEGYNSVCIRVKEVEDESIYLCKAVRAVPKDGERIDLGGLNSGYLRVKDDARGLNHLYYINNRSKTVVRLQLTARQLSEFDAKAGDLSIGQVLPMTSGLVSEVQKAPNHPKAQNGLYYANRQQGLLIRLTVSASDLALLDTMPHNSSFGLNAIPEHTGNLMAVLEPYHALGALMPGVSMEYVEGDDVHRILTSHILSEDHDALFPVRALVESRITASREEERRLESHSSWSRSWFTSKQAYESLISDSSTLLGQLLQLCRQLSINSVTGLGEETNAGGGAYPAIIAFMTYYHQLTHEERSRIPAGVRSEIDTLFALTTDAERNSNATENLETCIATRKSSLMDAMSGHDALLDGISIRADVKQSLLLKAEENLQATKKDLNRALDEGLYEGQDALGLNLRLMETLGVRLSMNALRDLDVFKSLMPEEIQEVLQEESLRTHIIYQLRTLENLVVFALEMPVEKLSAWFIAMAPALGALIRQHQDFSALLISLDLEKCRVICEAIKAQFPELIRTAYDFGEVLQDLSPEQRTAVYEAMKARLPELITSDSGFGPVLRYLSPEQRTAVYEAMKVRLPELIIFAYDFGRVLALLNLEQRTAVYEAMKARLPELITSTHDFEWVLHHLSLEQRTAVYESMKARLPELITSASDFVQVLRELNPEQCTAVCDAMKARLPELITSAYDFGQVLRELNPEQCTAVYEAMKARLPELIASAYGFGPVLQYLSPTQCTAVCEAMKARWPELITSAYDFGQVLRELNPEQRTAVYEAIKARLPELITSESGFGLVLQYLSPTQCTAVCEAMKARWPDLIRTAYGFRWVLAHLNPEQCIAVCEAMKARWSQLIVSTYYFDQVLAPLNPEQRTAVCEAMKARLPALITSADDFGQVLHHLNSEQCIAVCEAMKARLPKLIVSTYYFDQVLAPLNPEQRTAVCEAMKARLANLIDTPDDLMILRYLTPKQCAIVCEAMKARLPELIASARYFGPVLEDYLNPEQCAAVYETMKSQWLHLIASVDDLTEVLRYLSPAECTMVCEAIKARLPDLITTASEFGRALSYLSPAQCRVVCESMSRQLPRIIKSDQDLALVLDSHLGKDRRGVENILREILSRPNELSTDYKEEVTRIRSVGVDDRSHGSGNGPGL